MVSAEMGRDPPINAERPPSAGGLVGRVAEMAALRAAFDDVVSGRGRLVLVGGEPGIGKSRLGDDFGEVAQQLGAAVLWGRCWEAGGAPAYWPWVQALRAYAARVDESTLRRQLGAGAADVVQILPELSHVAPDIGASVPADPDTARFRLFDAVSGFLSRAAEDQPIVLILDDLQAADVPSLLLLRFLAGALSTSSLLVVGTYRDVEVNRDHPFAQALAELVRFPTTRSMQLRGLELGGVARYVEILTGTRPPREVVAAIHRETEGNPLFLGEVARLAASEGRLEDADPAYWERAIPQSVRQVIGMRVDRLSRECSRTLSLASVLGREFDVEPLAQISGLSGEELDEVIDEATAARVISEVPRTPGRLRFGHALIRDTLYDELPPSHRARLHARAGLALEELYGSDPDQHLAELAHHFFEAFRGAEGDRAITYARRAGDRALGQLAYEEAVRLYRMALRALERRDRIDDATCLELLLSLGDAEMRAGDARSGRESFRRAADTARRVDAPELMARAALGYGGRFVWARDPDVIPLLEAALRALPDEPTPLRAGSLARLAGALRSDPVRERRALLSAQAVEMARRLGDPATLAYTLDGRYSAIWGPDTLEERRAIAEEIIALAEEIGDDERAFQGHHYRLVGLLETGDLAATKHELDKNARAAEALHQPAQRWYAASMVALLALFEGRLAAAAALIEDAYRQGHSGGVVPFHPEAVVRMQEYALHRELGDAVESEEAFAKLADEYWFWSWHRAAAVHLQAELGRTAEARRQFDTCAAADFKDWPLDNDWLLGLTLFADVCTYLGDSARASALYNLLAPYEDRNAFGHPFFSTGSVARSLANLAATMGRLDDAERHFTTALEHNVAMGALPWVAHTRHDLAVMLLARDAPGDRHRAIDELHQAAEIAAGLGQAALKRKVDNLLRGLGVIDECSTTSLPEPETTAPANEFLREGDYWLIAFEERRIRLQHAKGLTYLATLLERPGQEVHALDLISPSSSEGASDGHRARREGLTGGRSEAGDVLDARARREYRERIEELQAEIDEATGWHDSEREARARAELEFLVHELSAATGLGGRTRRLGSDAERARVNATRAIRSAMSRIKDHDPALGRHLEITVHTGAFCVYQPDPRAPVGWVIQSSSVSRHP